MKKIFLLPLLVISLSVFSQVNDTTTTDTFQQTSDAKISWMQDSLEKRLRELESQRNTRNLEDVMRTVEKRRKKDKSKAILYIVIGVGLMLVLVARFMRKNAEKKVNSQ